MRRKLLLAGFVLSLAAAAVTGYTANRTNQSDLLTANINALADDESLGGGEGDRTDFTCRCGLTWGKGCHTDN